MNIDVTFTGGNKAFNTRKILVKQGETFKVQVDLEGASDWASVNDPVLTIPASGNDRDIVANELGTAKIQFQNGEGETIDVLLITVI